MTGPAGAKPFHHVAPSHGWVVPLVRPATLISFELTNDSGVLATVGAAVAVEDVQIHGFTLCTKEATKTVHLVTEDESPSLAMLDDLGISRRSRDVLLARVDGGARELGELGRRLADAGVDVEASMTLDGGPGTLLALAVDEPARARKVLDASGPLRRTP